MPSKVLKKLPTKLEQGKLWSHQIKMLRYALSTQHPALIVDMRMGKTRVVVRDCKIYGAENILIVGPYSTFDGWRKELALIGEEPIEIIGTTDDRLTELESNWATCTWFMINKEGYGVVPQVKNYPWDVVILDESTFVKNPKTQVTQFFNANFRDVKRRWILSALPDPEGEMDYFGQLRFLDREILPFKNWYEFQRKYFEPMDVSEGYGYKITQRGKNYLSQRLAKYCFFMTKEDAGIKNTKVYEKRIIKMSDKIREAYKTAKREFLLEVEGMELKRTMFAGAKYVLMRQLLGGVYEKEVLWEGKVSEVENLIFGELKKEQIIIWCSFRDEAELVYGHFQLKVKCGLIWGSTKEPDRARYIHNFNKGYTRILIITAGCMKFGANLSKASTCIYYSSPFGEARHQSEERIVSIIGPPSLIIDIVVKNSVEEDIYEQRLIKQSERKAIRDLIKKWQYEENINN